MMKVLDLGGGAWGFNKISSEEPKPPRTAAPIAGSSDSRPTAPAATTGAAGLGLGVPPMLLVLPSGGLPGTALAAACLP